MAILLYSPLSSEQQDLFSQDNDLYLKQGTMKALSPGAIKLCSTYAIAYSRFPTLKAGSDTRRVTALEPARPGLQMHMLTCVTLPDSDLFWDGSNWASREAAGAGKAPQSGLTSHGLHVLTPDLMHAGKGSRW